MVKRQDKKIKTEYRIQLEPLSDLKLMVLGKIDRRGSFIRYNQLGQKLYYKTICLKDVWVYTKCNETGKAIKKAYVDHAWISEEHAWRILANEELDSGSVIKFYANTAGYMRIDGKKNIGFKQLGTKYSVRCKDNKTWIKK